MAHRPLSAVVHDQILELLGSGAWAPDSQLPTEDALAQRFSVSRPVVRQALGQLREAGHVYTRRGAGTFVRQALPRASFRFEPLYSIGDIRAFLEFRAALEGEIAAAAASQAGEAARVDLAAAGQAVRSAVDGGSLAVEPDVDFHLAVARAAGNRFFLASMEAVRPLIIFSIGLTRELNSRPLMERRQALLDEHGAILDAILRRDPGGARLAMTDHLHGGVRRLFGQ